MEITGKIIAKLQPQSGVSKNGNNWSKQEYVLETQESFPKKVHFDFFGERANQYNLEVGQMVKLSFDIESREYNGRWFTSIRGWEAETVDAAAAPAAAPFEPAATPGAVPPPPAMQPSDPNEDLPF